MTVEAFGHWNCGQLAHSSPDPDNQTESALSTHFTDDSRCLE